MDWIEQTLLAVALTSAVFVASLAMHALCELLEWALESLNG